jgi:c-di-GMP-binding flagellar brake protein YcgR
MILDGRLRYQRVDLDIQVSLRAKNNMITNAHLVNLSEGGMRIYSDQPIDAEGLQIRWEIPGAQSELNAQAEVVWHDDNGHVGVRFVKVPPQHQKALQLWLAQQFLAN